MTDNEAIKKHIEDCEHRIGNILGFMECNSDANTSICEENIAVLKTAIIALEEIQEYRAIGTLEECQAAVEKMKPKKTIKEKGIPYCPCCGGVALTDTGDSFLDYEVTHCDNCGQAIGEGE